MNKNKQWVVCLNLSMRPTTWGYLIGSGHVVYGERAPIWDSPFWSEKHLQKVSSEEEAEQIVRTEEDRP